MVGVISGMVKPSTNLGITKEVLMCARCVDGWSEFWVNGELVTSGFCDCDEGHELNDEMNTVWTELDNGGRNEKSTG